MPCVEFVVLMRRPGGSTRQLNLWVWKSRETFCLEMETRSPLYKTVIKGLEVREMTSREGTDSEKRH